MISDNDNHYTCVFQFIILFYILILWNRINEIETDIYEVEDENNNFDFEIVCPYCDYEFTTSIEGRTEIVCPKCNNVIELDWNDDDEDDCCAGHCHSCHGCGEEEYDDNDDDEYEENDEDDDM
mgnify:CR=1 FL=1